MSQTEPFFKIAGHALIKKGNQFLVARRSLTDDYMPGLWDIPGGTVEFEENILQCVAREVLEETGLVVKINNPIFVHDHINGLRHQFEVIYDCDYLSGDIILNPEDHDEFRWTTLEEIKQLPKIAFLEKLTEFLSQQS